MVSNVSGSTSYEDCVSLLDSCHFDQCTFNLLWGNVVIYAGRSLNPMELKARCSKSSNRL
jgi:hypothetical protein